MARSRMAVGDADGRFVEMPPTHPPLGHERWLWAVLLMSMALVGIRFFTDSRPSVNQGPRSEEGGEMDRLPVYGEVADFGLTNQFGVRVDLGNLLGHVWVANVIFSRCPGQCHVLSQQMSRVQARINPATSVRMVSLTADPEYDSPEVLEKYGRRYEADPGRWMFLTGPKEDVYRLAMESLKFSVVETPESDRVHIDDLFIHATVFALVDRQGRLRAFVQGEEPDAVSQIVEKLNRLVAESGP